MKKILALVLALALALSLTACGDKPEPTTSDSNASANAASPDSNASANATSPDSKASSITVSSAEEYDEEYTICIDGSGEWTPFEGGSGVTFESSSSAVGIADDGNKVTFTGLEVGEADITAHFNDKTAKALVKVIKRSEQKPEFTGIYSYNPPTDNFRFDIKFTEDGESNTLIIAKIGDEEAMVDGYADWQQFSNVATGAYYTVVDGHWYEDVSWGFYPFAESGLGSPFDTFYNFVQLLNQLGFGNEKLGDFYVGEETFLGVKCWVFDANGYNNIYAKYWVDPSNGCTLRKAGTTTDVVDEVTRYDMKYTEWESNLTPN